MRIGILANAMSVHTQRWARAYSDEGHDVHVFSIRHNDIFGVNVHPINVGPENSNSVVWTFLSYLYFLLTARRRIRKLAPDIVNAHYALTHGVIAAFADYHPFVISVWGSDVIWDKSHRMPFLLRLALRYAFKKADLICATSNFLANKVLEFKPPDKPMQTVPFGVDCQLFRPSDTPRPQKYLNQFRIGFVKTLAPGYGPDVLIRAMPKICREISGARLIMAGRDRMKGRMQQLAAELDVADRIEFTGFVPNDKVPEILQSFDVFAHPSVSSESFGVAVLEASACGLPVVATRVGGVPEVCIDQRTGFLIPPLDSDALAQAIILLAKDSKLSQRMANAGRSFVLEKYVWGVNVKRMLSVFEKLIST